MDINLKNKGFTIIEIVIAIFLLSLCLIVVYSAFSMIVISTADTENRLTATYLAQEGMEIVRNIRDTNWLNMDICKAGGEPNDVICPASWVDGLVGSDYGAKNQPIDCSATGCEAYYKTTGFGSTPLLQFANNPLKIDTNGFYSYDITGDEKQTIFQRRIIITSMPDATSNPPDQTDANDNLLPNHIIKVKVEVSWQKKATILNPEVSPFAGGECDPQNCIMAEETLYNWYNYISQ